MLCISCGKDHWNDECLEFPTPQVRKGKAQALRLCLKRLRKADQFNQCVSEKRCFHCCGAHNSVFYFRKQKDGRTVVKILNNVPRLSLTMNASIRLNKNDIKTVLLICCKVNVVANTNHVLVGKQKTISAVVFFTIGSQLLFVTKRFAQKIDLHGSLVFLIVATSF